MQALLLALLLSGQPPARHVVVVDTSIEILDAISFVPQSDRLNASSRPLIAAVAATLQGNPSLTQLAIVAYGPPALAVRRAYVVRAALIAAGVEPGRLVAQAGLGAGPERIELDILKRRE